MAVQHLFSFHSLLMKPKLTCLLPKHRFNINGSLCWFLQLGELTKVDATIVSLTCNTKVDIAFLLICILAYMLKCFLHLKQKTRTKHKQRYAKSTVSKGFLLLLKLLMVPVLCIY